MGQDDLQRGLEWAKKQAAQREHSFQVPDRQDDEAPITAKQLEYIKQLASGMDLDAVRGLGKWQASALIDHLQAVRHSQSAQLGEEWAQMNQGAGKKSKSGCVWKIVIGLIVLFVLLLLLR
jgi:hypothetical protein